MKTTYFSEAIDIKEALLDEENQAMHVTIIKPGWSKNGRYYSKAALKEAAPLFEGTKAFVDHPSRSEQKDRPERSVRDITGFYKDVVIEKDGRMVGDLHFLDEQIYKIAAASVTHENALIGLSINALGTTRKGEVDGKKGIIVETIVKANSTDIVTTPAAGGGFDNLLMSDDGFTRDLLEHITLEELREARPDFEKALKKEWKKPRDSAALVSTRARAEKASKDAKTKAKENRTLKAQLKQVRSDLLRTKQGMLVDRLLAGKRELPEAWRAALREELAKADPTKWEAILNREGAKLGAVKPRTRVSGAGRQVAPKKLIKKGVKPKTNTIRATVLESGPREGEGYSAWKRRPIMKGER